MSLPQYRQWCSGYARYEGNESPTKKIYLFCQTGGTQRNDSNDDDLDCGDIMQMQMSHKLRTSNVYYGREHAPAAGDRTFDGRSFESFYAASLEWHADANIRNEQLYFISDSKQMRNQILQLEKV